MTSPFLGSYEENEAQFLEHIRERFEADGFAFTAQPEPKDLPDFLETYRPDAIARRDGLNVAIEVKRASRAMAEPKLQYIRRLFEGHSDWQFRVVYMARDPSRSLSVTPTSAPAILERIGEVTLLSSDGHLRAAFILAWSLLEAATHVMVAETASRALSAASIVQALAMNGYIDPDLEHRLRKLIRLRDRVVHGDLSVEPAPEDVALVLRAVEDTLAAQAV